MKKEQFEHNKYSLSVSFMFQLTPDVVIIGLHFATLIEQRTQEIYTIAIDISTNQISEPLYYCGYMNFDFDYIQSMVRINSNTIAT